MALRTRNACVVAKMRKAFQGLPLDATHLMRLFFR
jgi:hypothetical protein